MSKPTTKFIVGKDYFYRHAGDHNLKAWMTVVSRTAKTVTIERRGSLMTKRVTLCYGASGIPYETISAGSYSMAGSWDAKNDGTEEFVETVTPVAPTNCIPFPSKAPTASPEPLPSLSRAEALPMVALGRKILVEALRTMGQQTEIDLIEAILDRDHWKMLDTLRGAIAAGKVG